LDSQRRRLRPKDYIPSLGIGRWCRNCSLMAAKHPLREKATAKGRLLRIEQGDNEPPTE
jgi:hypothetical protein